MEHQALIKSGEHIEKTFYQGVYNNTQEGVIFIDELDRGYKEFFYKRHKDEVRITFFIGYFTPFSNRISALEKTLRPKQVSEKDIQEFLKAYKSL